MSTYKQLAKVSMPEAVTISRQSRANNEMHLQDLWDIMVRRNRIVLGTLLACLLLGALYCAFGTRRYMATAELQVGRETENNLGLQSEGGQSLSEDSLSENITLQTQAGILTSDTLALKVIEDLGLESTQDFRSSFRATEYLLSAAGLYGQPDPPYATLEESPRRRLRALKVFNSNVEVKPVAGTRLIEISYLNPDPKLAAQVVNKLANSLVDYNFQIRHDATAHTAEWLAGQMSDLRKQSEVLQARVAELQRDSGVFSLGQTDASGREQVYSSVLDKLQQSTTALSQAEANRIGKAAIQHVIQGGDADAISQLSGSSIFASSSGLDSSVSLIQSLRMQEATLRGQIGEMAAKFGPGYPKLSEMQSHLNAIRESIQAEVKRLAQRAQNDYAVAQRVEDNARAVYMAQRHQAEIVNNKTIEYTIARKEAEESRNLYESLFRQLKQSGVLAGFRANNISVVDPARVQAKPARPRMLLAMAIMFAGGLFLGAGSAMVVDAVDTRIHNLTTFESDMGLLPLGVLPRYKVIQRGWVSSYRPRMVARSDQQVQSSLAPSAIPTPDRNSVHDVHNENEQKHGQNVLALEEPRAPFVEALRALRTSLLLSKTRSAPRTILITSSLPGEGKTTLSANFATLLADQGKRVLLVDADLRNPNQHKSFNITSERGLTWLLGDADIGSTDQTFEAVALSAVVPVTDTAHLHVLPSGKIPERPAELLASDRMRRALGVWRSRFDYVIIDGSPVLPVTDAVILSGMVEFTVLAARYNIVQQHALVRAYGILEARTGRTNIGIVLNAVEGAERAYYLAYNYKTFDAAATKGVSREAV